MSGSRSLAVFVALAALACGAAQKPHGARLAELRVIAEPPSAVVEVNETFVGAARVLEKRPAKLAVGPQRVTISAPGYFPHDLELTLPAGVTTLKIRLRPIPP